MKGPEGAGAGARRSGGRTFAAVRNVGPTGESPTTRSTTRFQKTGVIAAGENEAGGRRIDEVSLRGSGPNLSITEARDHHPADTASPARRSRAWTRACRPAVLARRQGSGRLRTARVESGEDAQKLRGAGEGGQAQAHRFSPSGRKMKKLVDPVIRGLRQGSRARTRSSREDQRH